MTSQWEEAVLNMAAASRHMYCSFGKSERLKERAKKPDLYHSGSNYSQWFSIRKFLLEVCASMHMQTILHSLRQYKLKIESCITENDFMTEMY